MGKIRGDARLSFLIFLIFMLFNTASDIYAQEEQFPFGEKQKIHVLPINLKPNDTYIASQITKSALRTLYQTGRYHILVGDTLAYRKIVIGVETLAIWARKYRDKYQITITWREQRKGKILKRLRATNVPKERFLLKIEELLGKLFLPQKFTNPPTIIIDKRKNKNKVKQGGGLTIREEDDSPTDIDSNVVVLTKEEIVQKRENPEEYYKDRDRKRKQKTWGKVRVPPKQRIVVIPEEEEIPDPPPIVYEEVEDPPPVVLPPPPKPEPEPEPPPPPKVIPKKPIYMRLGLYMDYENLATDDLLTGVNTNILRYGLKIEPRLWTINENSHVVGGLSLITYSKKVIFRELQKRIGDEYKLYLGYRRFFFGKKLELNSGLNYGNRWWANLAEVFKGIQSGELRTMELELGVHYKFDLFNLTHGLGAEIGYPITQSVKYGSLEYNDITSHWWKLYYDFYLGETSRIRAGYSNRALELGDKAGFNYSSTLFSVEFILDFSL